MVNTNGRTNGRGKQSAATKPGPGAGRNNGAAQTARIRRQLNAALRANAQLRSIPRQVQSKQTMATRGNPATMFQFAPRGHGHYDAFVQQPESLVLAAQVGPCTPCEGFGRYVFKGSVGVDGLKYDRVTGVRTSNSPITVPGVPPEPTITSNSMLFVFNAGSSDMTIARAYSLVPEVIKDENGNDVATGYAAVHFEEVLAHAFQELGPASVEPGSHWALDRPNFDVHNSNPMTPGVDILDPTLRVESIPIRGSFRFRNITEHFSVGGEVRIMRYNGGLLLGHDVADKTSHAHPISQDMGVAEFLSICDMMRQSKRAHTLTGAELLTTHQSNTYPADSIRSHTFEDDKHFFEAVMTPRFNTTLVLIDDFLTSSGGVAKNNTYSFSCAVQRAARFRPGSILHHQARLPQVNPNLQRQAVGLEEMKPPANPAIEALGSQLLRAGRRAVTSGAQQIWNSKGTWAPMVASGVAAMIPGGQVMAPMLKATGGYVK